MEDFGLLSEYCWVFNVTQKFECKPKSFQSELETPKISNGCTILFQLGFIELFTPIFLFLERLLLPFKAFYPTTHVKMF